jgi:uncharacterized protein
MFLFYVAFGFVFGWLLSRSGASDYNYIQEMFLFTDFQLYGIIGTAVVVTAPGLKLLRRLGRTVTGDPIVIKPKPLHRGTAIGAAFFGIGWALTGMCPGPVLVNVGEGKLYAIAALAGVLIGAGAVGVLYERLRGVFGLPDMGPLEERS